MSTVLYKYPQADVKKDMMTDPSSSSGGIDGDDGIWVGIDFGTTHSCAAVWDSNRGRPKVLRLASALPEEGGKRGRLVPTVLVLVRSKAAAHDRLSTLGANPQEPFVFYTTDALRSLNLAAVVGSPALRLLDLHQEEAARSEPSSSRPSPEQVSSAMVTDLKVHFSTSPTETSPSTILHVVPIGMSTAVSIEADVLVQVFLAAMRHESEAYLLQNRRKEGLVVPCANANSTRVDHAVIGVPCHWNQVQSQDRRVTQRHPQHQQPRQPHRRHPW
jgi:hypothetical protein